MDVLDSKYNFKLWGAHFQSVTRSNPVLVTLLTFLIVSIFSWLFDLRSYWILIASIYILVLLCLLIWKPERLQTEHHQRFMKLLDTGLLGDKGNPQVKDAEYEQLFQPEAKTTAKEVKV
jgi:phosphoglycerol transferase MdoB-like AlkP superfamily enzyme